MTTIKNNNLTVYFALYWLVFWAFNGLDKFLFHKDFGYLTWYGKDRDWQFSVYLTNMQLPSDMVQPILLFSGIWELLIATVFAIFVGTQVFNNKQQKNKKLTTYILGIKLSVLTFIGFCAFDVVAGDRAELLEHSTYIVVLAGTYLVSQLELVGSALSMAQKTNLEQEDDIVIPLKPDQNLKPIISPLPDASNDDDFQSDENDILYVLQKYRLDKAAK